MSGIDIELGHVVIHLLVHWAIVLLSPSHSYTPKLTSAFCSVLQSCVTHKGDNEGAF